MFWGFATCKSVIRDSVELFRAKSRCEDTFFETENWQTLSKMPYSQKKKKKAHKLFCSCCIYQKMDNDKKKIVTCIRMIWLSKNLFCLQRQYQLLIVTAPQEMCLP